MKMVYEASSGLEAHMLKNLLDHENIDSRIDGEYLQGGIGELQAMGIVRLMVDETNYSRAKEVIGQWEAGQAANHSAMEAKKSKFFYGFIFGVVMSSAAIYLILSSPVGDDGIDYDGDGFLEEKWIYRAGKLSETHIDRNYDGEYDDIFYYDVKGLLKSSKSDGDFDGFFESKTVYFHGKPLREETDSNQNGIVDLRTNYTYGVLDNIEFIDEDTGRTRKKQFFKLGKLISADYDSNGDGKFDVRYEYDRYEVSK